LPQFANFWASNYNYFRDYDPAIGRYVESDPIGLKGGFNTYRYVEANPLTNWDPRGLRNVDPDPYPGCGNDAACRAGLTRPYEPPTPPSCFQSCMLEKVGWQALRSLSFRTALTVAASQSTSAAAWIWVGTQAMARAVPYAAPFFIFRWIKQCIEKCDQCRDAGNKAFSYP